MSELDDVIRELDFEKLSLVEQLKRLAPDAERDAEAGMRALEEAMKKEQGY